MNRVLPVLSKNWRPWFFRAVAILAIIFAAGHSGGFLNQQEGALAALNWGVFGAIVAGLALWGGMYMFSAHGDRWGLAIALAAAVADGFMAYGWFKATNATVSPVILAVWPPLLAVLAGIIEGRIARRMEQERDTEAEKDKEAERRLREKLAVMEMKAKLRQEAPPQTVIVQRSVVHREHEHEPRTPEPIGDNERALLELLEQNGGQGTVRGLAEQFKMSVGKVHGLLAENGWQTTGKGQWSRNGATNKD